MSKKFYLLMSFVLLLAYGGSAFGAYGAPGEERWWSGLEPNNLWQNPNNWWEVAVPTIDDEAYIGLQPDLPALCIVEEGTTAECWYFAVGEWNCNAEFMMTGGAMEVVTDYNLGAYSSGCGTVYMLAGDVNIGGRMVIGNQGTGRIELEGGTMKANSLLIMDANNGSMDIGGGTLILSGNVTSLPVGVTALEDRGGGYFVFDYDGGSDTTTITTMGPEVGMAYGPEPADEGTGVELNPRLMWKPGNWTQSTGGHVVYFGTSFSDVNTATPSSTGIYQSTEDVNGFTVAGPLDWAGTYYWRIDQVNDTPDAGDGNSPWKGHVWNFTVMGASASEPIPADGSWDAPVDGALSWTKGAEAVSHEVYLSTDFNEVNDRDVNVLTVEDSNSHDPGGLLMATRYYWAVDEVNELSSTPTWYGDVWTFETEWYRVVDNMDSYTSNEDLVATWIDGYSTGDNGSSLYIEGAVVLGGNSMRYIYANHTKYSQSYGYGSEIEASTANLACGSDWTVGGVKSLVVPFYGQAGNSTTANDRMYVALKDINGVDVAVYYDGDANDVTQEEWQEWNIDLTDPAFSVLQMNNITTVYLGFGIHGGDKDAVGGEGEVYFDDIRLYPRRCRAEFVEHDLNGDCVADIWDLLLIGEDWLKVGNYWVSQEAAPETNTEGLIVWYKLDETDGTLVSDSSGNGNDGTATASNYWDPLDSADANGSLDLAGAVSIDVPNDTLSYPMNEITVSYWLKTAALDVEWVIPFSAGDDQDWPLMTAMAYQVDWGTMERLPGHYIVWRTSYYVHPEWGVVSEDLWYEDPEDESPVGWTHYAFTKIADEGIGRIYRDGQLMEEADPDWFNHPIQPIDPNHDDIKIGKASGIYEWGLVNSKIDDFRIYDHALPHSQILDLAGVAEIFVPMTSPANAYEDDQVDFKDFAIMANGWLEEQLWP